MQEIQIVFWFPLILFRRIRGYKSFYPFVFRLILVGLRRLSQPTRFRRDDEDGFNCQSEVRSGILVKLNRIVCSLQT